MKKYLFTLFIILLLGYLFNPLKVFAAQSCAGNNYPASFFGCDPANNFGLINVPGGTCYYSSNHTPPNWTTNENDFCSTVFGWGCPSFSCGDTPQPTQLDGHSFGYCGSHNMTASATDFGCKQAWGATVHCCTGSPPPPPTPNCNSNVVCSGCANPNNNTCGGNNGIGTGCTYTGYGGNASATCNHVAASNQNNFCNYAAGCNSGYSCINGGCYQNCSIGSCGGGCGDATTRYVTGSSQTCGGWFGGAGCYAFNSCSCTNGPSYGSCNPQVNTCNANNGTQTVTLYYTPRGDTYCTPRSYQQACTQSNCSTNYACSSGTCVTNITVNAYVDDNHNGTMDNGEAGFALLSTSANGHGSGTTDADGHYTFSGFSTGTYSVSVNAPQGYAVTNPNPATVNLTNIYGNAQVYFGLTELEISGTVSVDYSHNGTLTTYTEQRGTISVNGETIPLDALGRFRYVPPTTGTYTVAYNPPGNYINWGTSSRTYTISASNPKITNANFSITPTFYISGRVYNDVNKSTYYTPGIDIPLHTGTLSETGPTTKTITINADGTYKLDGIMSGEYTFTYAPPSIEYAYSYPLNLTTHVTVGAPCNVGQNHDSDGGGTKIATTCNVNNDIEGLNFGVSNEFAWVQGICTDMRVDNGFTNRVPSTADCNGTSAPYASICTNGTVGVIFSGNQDADFGLGHASTNNWLVGGSGYQENFTPVNQTVIRTSYEYVKTSLKQAGITPINLSTQCTIPDCIIPKYMPSGIYEVNDNLEIEPTEPGSAFAYNVWQDSNVIILVNGTTTIEGKILVPQGKNASFTLISKGNIIVKPQVGEDSPYSLSSDLDGLYSTNGSFIVQSASATGNSCNLDGTSVDKKLNIAGSVIVNAGETGGSFQNARDLCQYDTSCPTTTFSQRTDLLLQAADVIKRRNSSYQEQTP